MEAFEEMNEIAETGQETDLPAFLFSETKEMAPPMEVQAAEIRDVFFDMPELTYDNWIELTETEKMDALQSLEHQVAEIAMRDPLSIRAENLDHGVMGYCSGDRMAISAELLADNSYETYRQLMDTVFHEGRHAYQNYNLYVEQVEQNSEMVDAWRVNYEILGYNDGDSSIYKELGFYEYYSQPVEVDARVFAATVLNTLDI